MYLLQTTEGEEIIRYNYIIKSNKIENYFHVKLSSYSKYCNHLKSINEVIAEMFIDEMDTLNSFHGIYPTKPHIDHSLLEGQRIPTTLESIITIMHGIASKYNLRVLKLKG